MFILDIDMGWLVTLGRYTTCRAAARGGRLEVFKWMHDTLRLPVGHDDECLRATAGRVENPSVRVCKSAKVWFLQSMSRE